MITVKRAAILFFQIIYFALFVTFLVNGIWRWSESNISSRILTQESDFEWPSVTICPMFYNSPYAISYGTNMTFEDTKNIISMKDRTEVKLWTDWFYNETPKYAYFIKKMLSFRDNFERGLWFQ